MCVFGKCFVKFFKFKHLTPFIKDFKINKKINILHTNEYLKMGKHIFKNILIQNKRNRNKKQKNLGMDSFDTMRRK